MAPLLIAVILAAVVYALFFAPGFSVWGGMTTRLPDKGKAVALTFDDGPNEPYTSQLLDILAKEKVRATFFIVGQAAEHYPDTVRRIKTDGHLIGNHSFSHLFRNYLLHPGFRAELSRTQGSIEEIVGEQPHFFRPPWLFRQPWILRTARKLGLKTIGGTFGSALEALQPSPSGMARAAAGRVRPGTILIFHDGYNGAAGNRKHTVEAVALLIPVLKQRGYSFVGVDGK